MKEIYSSADKKGFDPKKLVLSAAVLASAMHLVNLSESEPESQDRGQITLSKDTAVNDLPMGTSELDMSAVAVTEANNQRLDRMIKVADDILITSEEIKNMLHEVIAKRDLK